MAEILAFSPDQVCRLTGLSAHQLRYWDSTGFFAPTVTAPSRHTPYGRVYSLRDVVGLRALAEMRNRYHVPLQELRRAGAFLREHYDAPWSQLRFYIADRRVYYQEGDAVQRAAQGRQHIMPFELARVEGEVQRAIEAARQRTPETVGRVGQHRYRAGSQPVIEGTRVPTQAIWEFHAAGYTHDAIAQEYPQLRPADIDAAIAFEKARRAKAS